MLEKYNETWGKVSHTIKNRFDNKLVYNKNIWKTKIKSYNGKINSNSYNNKIANEISQIICLSVILIDSIYIKYKSCYPQESLEECKYVAKNKSHLSLLLNT